MSRTATIVGVGAVAGVALNHLFTKPRSKVEQAKVEADELAIIELGGRLGGVHLMECMTPQLMTAPSTARVARLFKMESKARGKDGPNPFGPD